MEKEKMAEEMEKEYSLIVKKGTNMKGNGKMGSDMGKEC